MNIRSALHLRTPYHFKQRPIPISIYEGSPRPKGQIECLRHRPTRTFHTTPSNQLDDHYGTLQLQPGAPPAEIKKSFFKLSKEYHPDRNPDDQAGASKKFMAISEAYHVLGDEKKRDQYNQELQQQRGSAGSYSAPSGGSGFSAGARKASGLSKRRGTFHGPPPSFYRSGGWGQSNNKRRTNMGADPRQEEARRQQQQQQTSQGPYGGKTGDWPFSTDPNDVGHFDRERHFRSQASLDEQLAKGRRKRRSIFMTGDDMVEDEAIMRKLLGICGILGLGMALPFLFFKG